MKLSSKISNLGSYAFDEVNKAVQNLKLQGIEPIDFGVGDPIDATPEIIRNACKNSIDFRQSSGYPSYIGDEKFRETIAWWLKKRFNVQVDIDKHLCSTIGSKEGIFHFPFAFVNPGDIVISPNPGYPPYERGTLFAGGENYFLPLLPENNFLPDLNAIPANIAKKARILWINYPSNPCAALATAEFYRQAIDYCKKHDIILASDECYTEIYFNNDHQPLSVLQFADSSDPVVAFFSLSKRSNMTCYRVGWLAGNQEIIEAFKKVKTNIDSGTPTFIQDAAVAALMDETHVESMRKKYAQKLHILSEVFNALNWPNSKPKGTFYIWQRIPETFDNSVEFAKQLLCPDIGIIVTPGEWISHTVDGLNPGEKFVRFALVPSLDDVQMAAEKIRKFFSR